MIIGVMEMQLSMPANRSLKDKRRVLRSVKDRARAGFNVAIAEVAESMGVDLRKFLKKLDKDCFVLFSQRAGEKIDFPAPLQDQRMDDKEEFIYSPGGGGH